MKKMWVWACLILWPGVAVWGQSPGEAEALQKANDWRGAESMWRALAAGNAKDYRLWTSLGVALAHQGKFEEAISAYQQGLVLNPQAPETNLNLGLAYFKSGNPEKALTPLKKAAATLVGNEQIDTVLGMCLYGTGKYAEAVPYLEAAESKNPDNKELRFVIAQAYLWGGQYEQAKVAFQRMLASDPDSPQVQMLIGEAYDGLGRTDEAIEAFQKATEKGQLPDAHFGLGYLLWKTHKYQQATTEFGSELRLDPKNYKALAYLGDCEIELGDVSAGRRYLSEAIGIKDVLWISRFDLGKLDAGQKQFESAQTQYRRAIEIEPKRPEAHYRLAQVYQALGRTQDSRSELQIVTRLHETKNEDLILKVTGHQGEDVTSRK